VGGEKKAKATYPRTSDQSKSKQIEHHGMGEKRMNKRKKKEGTPQHKRSRTSKSRCDFTPMEGGQT